MKYLLHCSLQKGFIHALHGFGGDGEDFLLVRSASHFDWCCMDLLGHGLSPKSTDPEEYRVHTQVELVASQQKGEILLGYSMGARLALHTVLKYPKIYKGLILISGTAGLQEGREERLAWDRGLANRLQTSTKDEFWKYWSQLPIIKSQNRVEERFRQKREQRRMQADLDSLAASVLGFGAGVMPSVWNRLKEVQIPVLLIVGEEDQKYVRFANQIREHIATAELEILSNSGHAPHLEKPESVAKIIDGWISTLLL